MSDAVRAAVIQARSANEADRLTSAVPLKDETFTPEAIIRSKADILKQASQALIAQANQSRDSVLSLLQAGVQSAGGDGDQSFRAPAAPPSPQSPKILPGS
jgi:hypothetical protein